MNKERLTQLGMRWVLVVLPTIIVGYVTLKYLNFSYTALSTGILSQAIYFSAGLTIAYALYFFRARWVITFAGLWILYYLSNKFITKLPGEFDVFYTTARFQLYSTLFLLGWVFGLLLAKVRLSYLLIFAIFVIVTMVSVSNTIDISISYILVHLSPVLLYGLYMLFVTPLITDPIEISWARSRRLALRFAAFVILVLLAFIFTEQLFRGSLNAVEKELAARGAKDSDKTGGEANEGGYDERYGLMEKNDDGYRLKDTMKINSKMSQSERLMFCSKLDSYFPDGKTPMPLYFVYHYLTRYDPQRESFVRDTNVPYFDEFDADPSELPMYHRKTDSTVIENSLGRLNRKVITADVYLSANTWKHSLLGPATVFSVQPIPVEKDFQKTFYAAYKLKAYISELNNAYFVYNVSANPFLESFQKERHDALRNVFDYRGVDSTFYRYYTIYPKGAIYDSIAKLAQRVSEGANNPIDKVLAIRNFFLERGPTGKRIFRYTLKPGAVDDPNIPSTQMLYNFLFKSHAGYCTYYAGASLFMLRSLGIPARFTTGFATINRSDKNKGWYWFYASQAHAWTQVYFPGYGWMDFDMTIGNEDQQDAPKPDGTPPLPPPEPWLVLNARTEGTPDLTRKQLEVTFNKIVYFNEQYSLKKTFTRTIDASLCRVLYDKKDTTLSVIQPGDSIIVVSYKDEAKQIPEPKRGVAIERQVDGFPTPIVADEIHVKSKEKKTETPEAKKKPKKEEDKGMTWQEMLRLSGKIGLGVLLFFFLLPLIYLLYRLVRILFAGNPTRKADMVYRAALYRFHMAGVERESETPLDYARTHIDPVFQTSFEEFMKVYLRLKYSNPTLQEGDKAVIDRFAAQVGPAIRRQTGFRIIPNYLNLLLAGRYFFRPQQNEYETQSI